MAGNVVLAEAAWGDLDKVYDWVADRTDPDTAQRYVMRILRQCGTLSEFPRRGTPRDDLAEGVRTIAFERRATIAYRFREDVVTILRVLHHGRDIGSAFPH